MNRSGKYNEYHEQLKYSVIRIVREKYLKKTNFTSDEEFKTFLEVLYVFLVKEMHKSLNQVWIYGFLTVVLKPVLHRINVNL